MLHKGGKQVFVEQTQTQPTRLAGADVDFAILRTLPIAIEGGEAKGFALLGIMNVRGQRRIDGIDGGVEGGMGQLADRAGERAGLLGDEVDDDGVEGVGHG